MISKLKGSLLASEGRLRTEPNPRRSSLVCCQQHASNRKELRGWRRVRSGCSQRSPGSSQGPGGESPGGKPDSSISLESSQPLPPPRGQLGSRLGRGARSPEPPGGRSAPPCSRPRSGASRRSGSAPSLHAIAYYYECIILILYII